ncbi:hypothetical protein CF336_g4881 [Tilletia laevis]|uniref:Uncharacterized protein n=1 Tax=Tilletia caries TaxID=13290 RepID=A0A177VB72_9BASI|nr:hypothetical protein CF336_g4881 [Tilletia laevis]KAE8200560.1 hypothetical protein CF335_g3930 [Tilletia laevis]KAE8259497.1 hypothetical protein A4X03_0g4072 [Tilletia caries]CAD7069242.1 unnamed protein product [Tilletia caries]
MGVYALISLLPHGIVGAWQHLPSLRPRIVLWRNAGSSPSTPRAARVTAGRDARTTGTPPNFCHCDVLDVLSFATSSVVSALTAAWARISQDTPTAGDRF